jgi:hypothetical protein
MSPGKLPGNHDPGVRHRGCVQAPDQGLLSSHFETSIPLGHLPQCAPFAVSRSLVLNSVSLVISLRASDAQVVRVHCHTSQGQ